MPPNNSCFHQFIPITAIQKAVDPAAPVTRYTLGVVTGCAICGQVRHLFEDGTVEIVKPGTEE